MTRLHSLYHSLLPLYSFYSFCPVFIGICAKITPAKINTQPKISRVLNACPKSTQPANTENTDSKLISNDAMVGLKSFCPTICKVYPKPQDNTPAYNSGIHAYRIFPMSGVSVKNMQIPERIPQTKNCIQDNLTPSTIGAKWFTVQI